MNRAPQPTDIENKNHGRQIDAFLDAAGISQAEQTEIRRHMDNRTASRSEAGKPNESQLVTFARALDDRTSELVRYRGNQQPFSYDDESAALVAIATLPRTENTQPDLIETRRTAGMAAIDGKQHMVDKHSVHITNYEHEERSIQFYERDGELVDMSGNFTPIHSNANYIHRVEYEPLAPSDRPGHV